VAILYPHKESKLISELSEEEVKEIDAVMAIDCTWHQAKQIIKELPDKPESNQAFVILKDYKTTFWRSQHYNDSMLATIESIYYFYKEYQRELITCGVYQTDRCEDITQKSFDDLLFFYCLNLEMIISSHKRNPRGVSLNLLNGVLT
jgi:hypothetical protein